MENNNEVPDKNVSCPRDFDFDGYYHAYYKAGLWPVRTVLKPRGDGSSEIVPYSAFAARYEVFKGPSQQDILDAEVNGKIGTDGISLVMHDGLFAVEFDSADAQKRFIETVKQRLVPEYLDTHTILSPHSKLLRYLYRSTKQVIAHTPHFIPGVDIIGDGTTLRTEPTVHPEGGCYEITNPAGPLNLTPHGVSFLLEEILGGDASKVIKRRSIPASAEHTDVPEVSWTDEGITDIADAFSDYLVRSRKPVRQGTRNALTFALSGMLVDHGLSNHAITRFFEKLFERQKDRNALLRDLRYTLKKDRARAARGEFNAGWKYLRNVLANAYDTSPGEIRHSPEEIISMLHGAFQSTGKQEPPVHIDSDVDMDAYTAHYENTLASEQETKAKEEKLSRELHNLEEMSERPIYDANSMEESRKRFAKYAMDAAAPHVPIPYGDAMHAAQNRHVFQLLMESGLKPDSYNVWPCNYNTARHNNCGHGTLRPVFEADPTNNRSSAGRAAQYFGDFAPWFVANAGTITALRKTIRYADITPSEEDIKEAEIRHDIRRPEVAYTPETLLAVAKRIAARKMLDKSARKMKGRVRNHAPIPALDGMEAWKRFRNGPGETPAVMPVHVYAHRHWRPGCSLAEGHMEGQKCRECGGCGGVFADMWSEYMQSYTLPYRCTCAINSEKGKVRCQPTRSLIRENLMQEDVEVVDDYSQPGAISTIVDSNPEEAALCVLTNMPLTEEDRIALGFDEMWHVNSWDMWRDYIQVIFNIGLDNFGMTSTQTGLPDKPLHLQPQWSPALRELMFYRDEEGHLSGLFKGTKRNTHAGHIAELTDSKPCINNVHHEYLPEGKQPYGRKVPFTTAKEADNWIMERHENVFNGDEPPAPGCSHCDRCLSMAEQERKKKEAGDSLARLVGTDIGAPGDHHAAKAG